MSPMPLGLLLGLGLDLLLEGRGRKRTHGAEGVKEHLYCLARGCGRPAERTLCSDAILIHMTLGNGYLDSRIDEERSKMRYLV